MNICFASDKNKLKEAALSAIGGFYEVFAPPPEKVDILVLNGDCDVSCYKDKTIDICIFDTDNALKVLQLKKVNGAVSCGMQELDSVTFSSISTDSAFVCIRRQIVFGGVCIDPCEFKSFFDNRMGIYYNLVISLLSFLSDYKNKG